MTKTQAIEGVVLRYGAFYGPGTWYAPDGDIAHQVRRRRFPLVGSGEGVISWIHMQDAAAATVLALEGAVPEVYNVVDDEPVAYREWLPSTHGCWAQSCHCTCRHGSHASRPVNSRSR